MGNRRAALEPCRAEWDAFFASLRFPSVAPATAGNLAGERSPAASADASRPSTAAALRPGKRAGTVQFENIVFAPPAGWNVEQGGGTITLTPTGTRGAEVLRVLLLPGRTFAGPDLTLTTNKTDHRFGRLTLPDPEALVGTWCLNDGRCLRLAGGGRFEDGGAVLALEHSTYPFPESPGSGEGRYEVRDYTLLLRYDRGPDVRLAFLGLAGTSTAPQMLVSFNVDVLTRR